MHTPDSPIVNSSPEKPARSFFQDPVFWLFTLLSLAAVAFSIYYSGDWLSVLSLVAGLALAGGLIRLFTRNSPPPSIALTGRSFEPWVPLAYYLVYLVLSLITRGEGILANEFTKWIWFVILPLLCVISLRRTPVKEVFRSIGFRRQGLGKALLLGLIAYLAILPFTFFFLPEAQLLKLQGIFQEPFKALILFPVCLVFSLATAAITEEVFFRGILQPRLSRLSGSGLRGCLIGAFLFGIYHLPYAFFSSSWPTHGNLLWAVFSVMAEQMLTGVVLGILWARTRNIAASILMHALVNVLAIMSILNLNFG